MADRQFEDPKLAALYDKLSGRESRGDLNFYLPFIMEVESILDVGCGTGALLKWAREQGHTGRLTGLDPAEGMITVARSRTDIEWVHGDLSSVAWDAEFDLVVMSGHAFQVFVTDEEIRSALAAIHRALRPGGTFAFETRNPAVRAWERWKAGRALDFTAPDGSSAHYTADVEEVTADTVSFRAWYTNEAWDEPEYSTSTLRFLGLESLNAFLTQTGFDISAQYGNWDRSPLSDTAPEIITLAVRA